MKIWIWVFISSSCFSIRADEQCVSIVLRRMMAPQGHEQSLIQRSPANTHAYIAKWETWLLHFSEYLSLSGLRLESSPSNAPHCHKACHLFASQCLWKRTRLLFSRKAMPTWPISAAGRIFLLFLYRYACVGGVRSVYLPFEYRAVYTH